MMLTAPQQKTLAFIRAFLTRTHRYPTYREIMAESGQKSPSPAFWLVGCLIERGFLIREGRAFRLAHPVPVRGDVYLFNDATKQLEPFADHGRKQQPQG